MRIGQPAFSRHIANLENELGVELFERRTTGVCLIEVGRVVLVDARRIAAEVKRARQSIEMVAFGTGRRLRLEGIPASAAHRAAALGKALSSYGVAETLDDAVSAAVWSSVRDAQPFAANGALGAWPVWRIVCPPATGGVLGERLARDTGGDVIYDWGGGLIWAGVPPKPDAQAALMRQRVDEAFGHATLLRASEEVRRNVDVFHPQAVGLAELGERVRQSFDPKNILNRGRLIRGSAA